MRFSPTAVEGATLIDLDAVEDERGFDYQKEKGVFGVAMHSVPKRQ